MTSFFNRLFFKNTQVSQIIFKNTGWMLVANIVAKVFKFSMMIVVAKLGPSSFGEFNYIVILSGACFILSDIGLNLLIIRDYQNKNKKELISAGAYIKLTLVTINTVFAVGCCFFIEPKLLTAFVVFTLMNIIDSIKQYNTTIARANLNQEIEAIGFILETTITSILGILFMVNFGTLLALAFAYLIGSICSFVYLNIKTIHDILPLEKLNIQLILNVIKQMGPFVLSSFLFIALTSVDTLMIKWMIGSEALGYYQSGLKLTETLLIIPIIFSSSLYPLVSKVHLENNRLKALVKKSTNVIQLIAFPMISGAIILAHPIVVTVFSNAFIEAVNVFKYLLVVALITHFSIIFQQILLGCKYEKETVKVNSVGFIINIILNIILIPKYGIIGAAMGSIVGRGVSCALLIRLLAMQVNVQPFTIKKTLTYLAFSIIMVAVVIACQLLTTNTVVLVIAGIVTYLSLLFLSNDPILKKTKAILFNKL